MSIQCKVGMVQKAVVETLNYETDELVTGNIAVWLL